MKSLSDDSTDDFFREELESDDKIICLPPPPEEDDDFSKKYIEINSDEEEEFVKEFEEIFKSPPKPKLTCLPLKETCRQRNQREINQAKAAGNYKPQDIPSKVVVDYKLHSEYLPTQTIITTFSRTSSTSLSCN